MGDLIGTYRHPALWFARGRVMLWTFVLGIPLLLPPLWWLWLIGLIGLGMDLTRATRRAETLEVYQEGFVLVRGTQRIEHRWSETQAVWVTQPHSQGGQPAIQIGGEGGCLGVLLA